MLFLIRDFLGCEPPLDLIVNVVVRSVFQMLLVYSHHYLFLRWEILNFSINIRIQQFLNEMVVATEFKRLISQINTFFNTLKSILLKVACPQRYKSTVRSFVKLSLSKCFMKPDQVFGVVSFLCVYFNLVEQKVEVFVSKLIQHP